MNHIKPARHEKISSEIIHDIVFLYFQYGRHLSTRKTLIYE